jgi:phosphoribosylaminoimidazole-succinocarboxamide synthase
MGDSLLQSNLPFPVRRGKVRDVYDLGEMLLIVATDRISAFDCILPNGIPDKGKILTDLSRFWFAKFADQFPNHLISTNPAEFMPHLRPFSAELSGRSMRGSWIFGRVGLEGISGDAKRLRDSTACRAAAMR